MNKWIFSFVLIFMTVCSAQSQLVLRYGSDTLSAPDGSIDVDVILESGFDDLLSFQFSVNWDSDAFTYSSIQNVTADLLGFGEGSIGAPPDGPGIQDGQLRVSWNTTNGDPFSLADGTRLFTLRLFGQGDLCSSTTVITANDPLRIEVIDNDLMEIDLIDSGGEIAIYDESCDGMMGPGVLLNVSNISELGGSNICIPVTTSNFDDIGSLQTGVTWDPSVLSFTGINNSGLTSVMGNSMNADNGELIVLWLFDQDAVSLPDGSTLFEICFDIIGTTNASTEIDFVDIGDTTVEIADIDGIAQDVEISGGTFTVGSDGDEEGVGIIFGEEFTNNQPTICVPITTRDFTDIAGLQTGITFDPNVLSYDNFNAVGIPGLTIGAGNADQGELRVVWILPAGSDPITIPDDGVLFELCFDVIGDEGDVSDMNFSGNLGFLPIEILDPDANELDFFVRNGSVTVGIEPGAEFTLIGGDVTGITGDTVCMPISARGFSDIEGMGFAHSWDGTLLRYIGQENFTLPNLGNPNFTLENQGNLLVLWTPTSAQSAMDGATLYEVCFEILGDCDEDIVVPVNFVDGNTPLEVVGPDGVLNVDLDHGSIAIGDCEGSVVNIVSNVGPTCAGDLDGVVEVDFTGTSGAVSCVWVDADDNEVSDMCNLIGVGGGTYTITATDDAGTVITRNVQIVDPGEIEITPTVLDKTCEDTVGSLSLSVSGGTGAYTYTWSGGLADQATHSPIEAGTYNVTVSDANECSNMTTVTVADNRFDLDIVINAPTNGAMDNGSIDLNPGTSVDASYSWSTGDTTSSIEGLTPGTYTVTIMDNGSDCMSTLILTVPDGVIDELSVDGIVTESTSRFNGFGVSCALEMDGAISGTIVGACDAGPITATLNGDAITVSETGAINEGNLGAGEYELIVTDACDSTVSSTIVITEPDPLAASAIDMVNCPSPDGGTDGSLRIPVSGGVGTYSFLTEPGEIDADGIFSGIGLGRYNVVVEDDNGCQLMIDNITFPLAQCEGIVDCIGQSIVSPNGDNINDTFAIGCVTTAQGQPNTLNIYDRWGNTVYEGANYNNSWDGTDLDGTLLPEGGYMWVLVTGDLGQREISRGTVSILR